VLTLPDPPLADLVSAVVDPNSFEIQREIAEGWEEVVKARQPELKAEVHILGSIQEAVETVRGLKSGEQEVEVLVTGSLLLIGGLMEVARFPMEI
jgi:folylpolyglutamate synthase/dihydropteroate synthase